MLTNDMVRLIADLKNENRRLKSKQTIMGSTVATASSGVGSLQISLPAGTGGIDYYTAGDITMTLTPLDDSVTDPIMTFNIIATTNKDAPLDVSYQAPQHPTGMGGFGFGYAITSVAGTQATARYFLSHNYDMADKGTPVYLFIYASGTSQVASATVSWHNVAS